MTHAERKEAERFLTLEEITQGWEAWSAGWDKARDADSAAGRRYDHHRYAECASLARDAFYNSIPWRGRAPVNEEL